MNGFLVNIFFDQLFFVLNETKKEISTKKCLTTINPPIIGQDFLRATDYTAIFFERSTSSTDAVHREFEDLTQAIGLSSFLGSFVINMAPRHLVDGAA